MGNNAGSQANVELPTTFEEFLADVEEANQIGQQFKNEKRETLCFCPSKEDEITLPLFWRSFCKVKVTKVLDGSLVLNSKNLNYKQFYRLFKVMRQYGCLELDDHTPKQKNQICSALIQDEFSEKEEQEIEFRECPICFEREADTVFPCAHHFCHQCADDWQSRSEECPMCREKISSDESWLMLDSGDSVEDISKFLYKFVDKL